jgi:threonine aldolase
VDVLCFGGAKNGLALGEAIVFFDRQLAVEFDYRCKQAGQLAAKMRFLAAPWAGILEDGAWLRHAAHANSCAREIENAVKTIPGVRVMFPCQANSVFLEMPQAVAERLRQRGWHFYSFIGSGGARFMCSWETRQEEIDALVADLREVTGGS